MIIELLLDVLMSILFTLTAVISIPALPVGVATYIAEFTGYMVTGATILNNYVPFSYLFSLLVAVVIIDGAIRSYRLIMFFIKKIPMLNIKD